MDLGTSMWKTLQYLHFLESICLTSYSEHGIRILEKNSFVSWFTILLQNDVGIVCFLGFATAMQYPLKFQKICYGAQRFYGIP